MKVRNNFRTFTTSVHQPVNTSSSYCKLSAFKLVKRFVTDLWLLYWRRGQIYYKLLALSQCNREKSSFDPTRSQKQTFLRPCAHLRYSRVPPWTSSMLVISNQYLKWQKSSTQSISIRDQHKLDISVDSTVVTLRNSAYDQLKLRKNISKNENGYQRKSESMFCNKR